MCDNSSIQVNEQYKEILAKYKNHSDSDYENLIINRTYFEKKELWDANGNNINWNKIQLVRYWARFFLFWFITSVFFVLGCITYILIFLQLLN